jgi:MFS family permease
MGATHTVSVQSTARIPLYALFAANMVSAVGDVLTFLAVPWFVLQTTKSITETGITAFCTTGAVALSALFGSTLVDRLGYKRASVLSDVASGVSVALVPLLYQLGYLSFGMLLVLVFIAGLFRTPGGTARSSLVPDLAERAGMRFERVTAATDGITRISRFFGAPLAGVLIGLISTSNLLLVDAASFAFSALVIGLAIPRLTRRVVVEEVSATESAQRRSRVGRYLRNLGQGTGFIVRDGVLASLVVTVLITNLLDAGFGAVLAPAYIQQVFGDPVVLGSIFAVFGGTAFLGTVIFGAIGHRLPRRATLGISFTLAGGTRFLALALVPFAPLLIAIQGVTGFFIGPVNPIMSTVEYERIPTNLRARVFGTITAGATIGMPLGGLLSGVCGAWLGIQTTLLVWGTLYLVVTASMLVNPALRHMEKPAEQPAVAEAVASLPDQAPAAG